MFIREILNETKKENVNFFGWIITNRGNNKIRFLTINDGSCFENIQVVVKGINAQSLDLARIGAAVSIEGTIKQTPQNDQKIEIISKKTILLKNSDKDFPIQKQKMTREYLRQIPHMRHHTKLFKAIMRIRSTLFIEIHKFFEKKGFLNVSTPIITSNDGEGAGETFLVNDTSKKGSFFDKKATLCVTGQLQAESYANGFGNVYAFGPTFRAENSNTTKHAAEFWMLEPEMAFAGIKKGIQIADNLLKTIIKKTIKKHPQEFSFFKEHIDKNLLSKLNNFLNKKIQIADYSSVIFELQKHKEKFEEKNIKFGIDLATEHEKFISSKIFNGPVAIINYPQNIKAFYMKQNKDKKTVAAFDILVPGIGELLGGSERECDYNKLLSKLKEMNISQKEMQWYLDLRRWGQHQSTGFGLGFERLVMYVTGIENIRDSIPYPRTPQNLKM